MEGPNVTARNHFPHKMVIDLDVFPIIVKNKVANTMGGRDIITKESDWNLE